MSNYNTNQIIGNAAFRELLKSIESKNIASDLKEPDHKNPNNKRGKGSRVLPNKPFYIKDGNGNKYISIFHLDKLQLCYIFENSLTDNIYEEEENPILFDNDHSIGDFLLRYNFDKKTEFYKQDEKTKKKKKFYHHEYIINYCGELFGTFSYENDTKNNYSSLKINKRFLYTNSYERILNTINQFSNELRMEFNNVSEIEIALDTTRPTTVEYDSYYTHSTKNEQIDYSYQIDEHKVKEQNHLHIQYQFTSNSKIGIQNGTSKTYYIGSLSETGKKKNKIKKTICLYNKDKHVEDMDVDEEILNIIKNNLGNPKEEIHRIELRLNNNALKEMEKKDYKIDGRKDLFFIDNKNLSFFLNPENLAIMFKIGIGNRFEIKNLEKGFYNPKTKKTDYSKAKFNMLELPFIPNYETKKYNAPKHPKSNYEINKKNKRNINVGMKGDFEAFLCTNDEKYFDRLHDIVSNNLLNLNKSDYQKKLNRYLHTPIDFVNELAYNKLKAYINNIGNMNHLVKKENDPDLDKMHNK